MWKFELWRHADEKKVTREEAVKELAGMLEGLIARAGKEGFRLAPFIGIGCPGIIEADGTIDRGAQNLPGNWESKDFDLPASLQKEIPTIGEHETLILLHNDAVVQGSARRRSCTTRAIGASSLSAPGSATRASPTERLTARINGPVREP